MEFDGIIGNHEIKEYLRKSVQENKMSQSYLFVGTEGIGKRQIAKKFAKGILCFEKNPKKSCDCKSCQCFEGLNHPDYFCVNENGETIKIDQIRDMVSKIIEPPVISSKKVYLINDCDKMTVEAQNCLLKTLEEPPEFAIIILITANENAMLNTIKSRCMTVKFRNIPNEELKKYAIDKLGYSDLTENLLKSFNGSIGKAISQKENQEKYLVVEKILESIRAQDIIEVLKEAKVLYEKDEIGKILEYMIVCVYAKKAEDIRYIDCVEKIDYCQNKLKRNCNLNMSLDELFLNMWECFQN